MITKEDLRFRPANYFGPVKLAEYQLGAIKGDVVRKGLKQLAGGGDDPLNDYMTHLAQDRTFTRSLESFHPMFMGGNYLPDMEENEVEIARISIESTTNDVTCVYARFDGGSIHYRVVDEYEGDTLSGEAERVSAETLTLEQLADFFLDAWSLIDCLEMNFENDLDGALNFFVAESEFYSKLDELCRERVAEHYQPYLLEEDDDE